MTVWSLQGLMYHMWQLGAFYFTPLRSHWGQDEEKSLCLVCLPITAIIPNCRASTKQHRTKNPAVCPQAVPHNLPWDTCQHSSATKKGCTQTQTLKTAETLWPFYPVMQIKIYFLQIVLECQSWKETKHLLKQTSFYRWRNWNPRSGVGKLLQ